MSIGTLLQFVEILVLLGILGALKRGFNEHIIGLEAIVKALEERKGA